ncbi:hypothetical protein [Actinomadura mexicana]|uniref:Uncharacterized protein n=1 Tax=Actinomadura mexicana TaxID=134959 RepID=A0A239DKM3_9ACTN|nr:hypothetical protein [Actinomadura mexicana]SNS33165.1 hypothetical protein SAMN06265355_11546 [Actinomadura mexicana]
MHNCARTALTGAASGAAGALSGALALIVALGVWAGDPRAVVTVPGTGWVVITGAIFGFVGGFIGGLVGSRMGPGNAALVLGLFGGYGLLIAYMETVGDGVLHFYLVDLGVVLFSIGINAWIASIIATARRR